MPRIAFKTQELPILATILLDAALADGEMDGSEADTIKSVLRDAGGVARLPHEVADALRAHDPDHFDLGGACTALGLETRLRKRELLGLVGNVVAADGVLDASEIVWLDRLAVAMGRTDTQMERFRVELVDAMAALTGDDPEDP